MNTRSNAIPLRKSSVNSIQIVREMSDEGDLYVPIRPRRLRRSLRRAFEIRAKLNNRNSGPSPGRQNTRILTCGLFEYRATIEGHEYLFAVWIIPSAENHQPLHS